MSRNTIEQKRELKRQQLVERTRQILSLDSDQEAIDLLSIGRHQALRINPLKGDASDTLAQLKVLQNVEIAVSALYKDGFTIKGGHDDLRDSSLQQDGFIYIQNAASWLPALQLAPAAGDRVLDVCAAPGGKTSLVAALADNKASITANDNSRPRLMRLKANLTRLGVENTEYTLYDASRIAHVIKGEQFDKILLDAPCSGEGMMRYDIDKDFDSWSVAHIKRLGKLQRRIIQQAWQLLAPGGSLVYSTCTMAPEENEAVVDYLLRHVEDAEVIEHSYPQEAGLNRVPPLLQWGDRSYDERIRRSLRLAPSEAAEAFYVCHLKKSLSTDN